MTLVTRSSINLDNRHPFNRHKLQILASHQNGIASIAFSRHRNFLFLGSPKSLLKLSGKAKSSCSHKVDLDKFLTIQGIIFLEQNPALSSLLTHSSYINCFGLAFIV